MMLTDEYFMQLAITLAKQAGENGEVPVGAIVVKDNIVIGEGCNQPILSHDPTAHAEIIAIRAAAQYLNNYRLVDCTLYVTLEPCAMCIGAILHSRISSVVFGASDPKTGACGSVINLTDEKKLNHHTSVKKGVCSESCGALLSDFFKKRRSEKRLGSF